MMSDTHPENDEKNIQNDVVLESEDEKFKNGSTEHGNEKTMAPIIDTKTNESGTPSAHPNTASQETAQDGGEEPPSERPIERVVSGEEYSVLTVAQKKLVILTVSLASLFSPMATAIYCMIPLETIFGNTAYTQSLDPSLTTIASDLHVTNAQVNITVTVFLVRFMLRAVYFQILTLFG